MRLQWAINAVDQRGTGKRISGQRPLGQQVVGLHRARCIAPGPGDGEAGQGCLGALGRVDQVRHLVAEHQVTGAEARF